jgi:hypothetical protein
MLLVCVLIAEVAKPAVHLTGVRLKDIRDHGGSSSSGGNASSKLLMCMLCVFILKLAKAAAHLQTIQTPVYSCTQPSKSSR